uniref:Uncharacterized protein n=1 Tax=Spermophilus dauricus TaxID=99837 RepID=A0A8C9P8Q5_SPEDA
MSSMRAELLPVLVSTDPCSRDNARELRLLWGGSDKRGPTEEKTLQYCDLSHFRHCCGCVTVRLLERALPGRAPRVVLTKVLCDQLFGGPIALSAFYVGEGPGQGPGDRGTSGPECRD